LPDPFIEELQGPWKYALKLHETFGLVVIFTNTQALLQKSVTLNQDETKPVVVLRVSTKYPVELEVGVEVIVVELNQIAQHGLVMLFIDVFGVVNITDGAV
jgi:hypothetical protein